MDIYEVEAPLGDEWKVKTDKTQGMIVFNKGGTEAGFTFIYILPGFLNPGKENQTEDEIVTMIFDYEENKTKERGATRSYALKNLFKKVTMIGGKKLHVMSYTNLGLPVCRELDPAHNKSRTTLLCFAPCYKS